MSALTAAISIIELIFFVFVGDLVDWLSAADRATFLADHAGEPYRHGAADRRRLSARSCFLQSLFMHQTIFGNYPMLVRWQAHRYLLSQSLSFFHNEFAGRVSQKVMQTALAVRDSVTKLIDVFVYVVVYFIGTLFLVARSDVGWSLPLVVWLAAYIGILVVFRAALSASLGARRPMRARQMTGRIVDSYTNIQTIKLFAHTAREQRLRPRRDGRIPGHRRIGRCGCSPSSSSACTAMQLAAARRRRRHCHLRLAAAVGDARRDRRGDRAWSCASAPCRNGSCGRWPASSRTSAPSRTAWRRSPSRVAIVDRPGAAALVVARGEIRFEHVTLPLRPQGQA